MFFTASHGLVQEGQFFPVNGPYFRLAVSMVSATTPPLSHCSPEQPLTITWVNGHGSAPRTLYLQKQEIDTLWPGSTGCWRQKDEWVLASALSVAWSIFAGGLVLYQFCEPTESMLLFLGRMPGVGLGLGLREQKEFHPIDMTLCGNTKRDGVCLLARKSWKEEGEISTMDYGTGLSLLSP